MNFLHPHPFTQGEAHITSTKRDIEYIIMLFSTLLVGQYGAVSLDIYADLYQQPLGPASCAADSQICIFAGFPSFTCIWWKKKKIHSIMDVRLA